MNVVVVIILYVSNSEPKATVSPLQGQWTPLHNAASKGHLTVVTTLLDNGADVDVTRKVSQYALFALLT